MGWKKWEQALVAAALAVGIASGQQPTESPPIKGENDGSILVLREPGKPDQRVKVLKVQRTPDGKTAYDVQDLKTGERGTIYDSGTGPGSAAPLPVKPAPSVGTRIRNFISTKIFGMGRSSEANVTKSTPPVSTTTVASTEPSLMPKGVNSAASLDPPAKETKQPVQGKLVSATESDKKPATKPAPAEAAPPTDWHMSWGKADNHQTPGSVKLATEVADAKAAAPAAPAVAPKSAVVEEAAPKSAAAEVSHHRAILQNAFYPSERERAAMALATMDWHANPSVLAALTQAAREDPAATVRAACVRRLVMMNARTESVLATLRTLKNDKDEQVRQEADAALVILSAKAK
jgi:hypothetical protein